MSIADKISTIIENTHKIYKSGQDSMIDEDKIIEVTETGTFINLREVSKLPHKIKIVPKGDSATVKVIRGRNLFNEAEDITKSGSYNDEWYLIKGYKTLNKYTDNSSDISFYANCDLKAGHCYYLSAIFKPLKAGNNDGGLYKKGMYVGYHGIDGSSVEGDGYNGNANDNPMNMFANWSANFSSIDQVLTMGTMVIPNVDIDKFLIAHYSSGGQVLMKKGSLMIVETETDYKEPRQAFDGTTYTIDKNGIEIDSTSPQMQFLSDSEISVTYHRSYGAQLMYDAMWGGRTLYGARTTYDHAFRDEDAEYFIPPVSMKPTSLAQAFASNRYKIIKGINTSKCTDFQQTFMNAHVKNLGVINTTSASKLDRTWTDADMLTTIEKLILKDDGSQTFTTPFLNCERLKNLEIEGVIGNNIPFSQSTKLTHDSLMNIIDHLKDFGLVYFHDNPEDWSEGRIAGMFDGYNITIDTTIEEGKTYTVIIKDDGYGDEQNPIFPDMAGEDRNLYFYYGETDQVVSMTYADGYLEATFTATGSLSGEFEVGIITDWAKAKLGSIEIRQTPTTTRTLTLSTTNLNKLTDAEKAIATEKGWTLA